jgi:hypothetical protein
MAGHSRPKDGVLSHAYVPAIHVFELLRSLRRGCHAQLGYIRVAQIKLPAASRVNPTCGDKRGHDDVEAEFQWNHAPEKQ